MAAGTPAVPDFERADAPHGILSGRVVSLLGQVAAQLESEADDIARAMIKVYEAEIPAYGAIEDDALKADVHAVSSAMVSCWLTVMSNGQPVEQRLLTPMTEGARRRAAQGIDMQSMLRAYRIGIRVMWNEITGSPAWRGRTLQGVATQVATWALEFADQICTAVAAAYLDEAAQVAREREHRRSALLNVILAGPGSERLDGPDELRHPHVVVVARVAPDLSLLQLEETGELLEHQAGAVLWTVRHRSVIGAVVTSGGSQRQRLRQQLGRLIHGKQIVALGLGGRAEGISETRQSYAEAVRSLQVGLQLGLNTRPVYDHQELAALVALSEHPDRARRFAASVLEPLGDLADRPWALPTLEAYLARQGHLKEVAAVLGIHLNTVKYRMNELRPFTDVALGDGDRAASVLLALRLHRLADSDECRNDRRAPSVRDRDTYRRHML
jgi:hypothetical protein